MILTATGILNEDNAKDALEILAGGVGTAGLIGLLPDQIKKDKS
jgi:hypothetical protein